MSYINSIYNSTTRMSGLSGIDVEGMVASLMQIEGAKVDKVSQDRQMLIWKQEAYREITSMLQSLDNEYFNSLKPATDMRNSSAYNAFAIKYDGADASSYFSAVAGTGAKMGEYTIKNIITAAAAKISGGNASAPITGNALDAGISINEANNKVSFTFNGTTKEITLDSGSTNAEQLRQDLQGKLNAAFGSGKISVTLDAENKLAFNTDSTNTLSLKAVSDNTGLAAIGMEGANASNRIDLSAKIYGIRNSFAVPLTVAGTDDDISFEINGQAFSFNSSTTSIKDIMAAVNANDAAGVRMSYDSLNNKFALESKQVGVTATVTTSDTGGGLLNSLSLVGTETGRDASITYNDGVNGDQVITRSTNSFNVNGITFSLKKDYAGSVDVEVSSDPTKAMDLIKGFVSKYNEVLDKINERLSEKRDYSYSPLTDSQKEAMKEEDIKLWEERAKAGILANDGTLRSIVTKMRNAMMQSVEGTGLTLASIGIKSSSWSDKGKLHVDEAKLTAALRENADQVMSLFTNQSDITYNSAAIGDAERKTERYRESGLIGRISDILQDNIRTINISGKRGALLERAGAVGDRSQYNNTLYHQISRYDVRIEKLYDELYLKEESYYSQFAQLETLINSMNTQSIWLSQQFAY